MHKEPYSLKQVQSYLNVPQHVLIHLCERGIIKPEVLDGRGRGKYRLFSKRNLFEFAVALELRRYGLAMELVGVVVPLLSVFESAVMKEKRNFSLPDSLAKENVPFRLALIDGVNLVFSVGTGKHLGVNDILDPKHRRIKRLESLPSGYKSCLSIDLVATARTLSA